MSYANEKQDSYQPLHLSGKDGSRAQILVDQEAGRVGRTQQEAFCRQGLARVLQGLSVSVLPTSNQHSPCAGQCHVHSKTLGFSKCAPVYSTPGESHKQRKMLSLQLPPKSLVSKIE